MTHSPSASAGQSADPAYIVALDAAFFGVLDGMCSTIIRITEGAVTKVLDASGSFLSAPAQKALQDFHALYFGDGGLAAQSSQVNAEVDDLFESISRQLASGTGSEEAGSIAAIAERVTEDTESKNLRLALSGLQKQLETLITVEAGVRGKLLPLLASMQFEDLTRQRLTRLSQAWQHIAALLSGADASLADCTAAIEAGLGSATERGLFYPLVLGQEPPAQLHDDETWFTHLI